MTYQIKILYDPPLKVIEIKTKVNKRDLIKLKSFGIAKETIKLLKENIGRTLDDMRQSKILHDPFPRVTEIKTKVNKWDMI